MGIGVYIGKRSISVAQVESKSGKAVLQKLALTEPPPETIDRGVILDVKSLARSLKELWDKENIGGKRVGFALPATNLIIRVITLPRMSESEVYEALRTEVEGYSIISEAEPVLDWRVVPESAVGAFNTFDVLFAATTSDNSLQYLSLLREAGLRASFLDVLPLAVARSFATEQLLRSDSSINIVAAVDSENTMVLAFHNGFPSFSHIIEVGNDSSPEAMEDLGYELELCCNFYRTDYPEEEISNLFLAVDSPDYKSLIGDMGARIGEQITGIDPLANIDEVECPTDIVESHALSCSAAIGLALREVKLGPEIVDFNLMPRSILTKAHLKRQLLETGIFMAAVLILGLGVGGFLDMRINSVREDLTSLRQEMARLDEQSLKKVLGFQREIKELRGKIVQYDRMLSGIKMRNGHRVLDYIRMVIPKDSWLEKVNYDEDGRITLNGYSFSEDSVFLFADMLRALSEDGQVNISMQRESSLVGFNMQFKRKQG
jgi:Tfp pilus assembly PilM family ATPase